MIDLGKVALRDTGEYDATFEYEILDIVEYQGYVYCCFTPNTPAGTLPTDSTHFHRWFGSASADNTYQTNDSVENDIDDADYIPFLDSSASAPKRSLWSNLKDKFWTYVQSQLADVATSGSYDDLEDKPTVDSALSTSSTNAIQNAPVATSMNALNLSLTQFGQTWDLLVYTNSKTQVYVPVNLSGYKFVAFCLTSYEHIAAQIILPVSKVSIIHSVSALINATNNPVIISYNGSTETSIAVRVITQDNGIYAHVYGIK